MIYYGGDAVAGVVNLQTFYDMVHPVGEVVIGFAQPTVPSTVTATWEDITSEFEGRSVWFSSSDEAGTVLSGSLPNITGNLGGLACDNNSGGVASSNGAVVVTKVRTRSWAGADGDEMRKFGIDASKCNSVYSAEAGKDVVRPDSIVIKAYRRTA